MPIITCVFHFREKTSGQVKVDCWNGNNAANSIENAIINTYKAMNPDTPGIVLVNSFRCKDLNNDSNLHDYDNRIIDDNDLIPNKVYDFEVEAIFTRADFGGRRRTRKSRKSRKSRKRR